jgi:transcriptional regulator with XRE-family HTH domain
MIIVVRMAALMGTIIRNMRSAQGLQQQELAQLANIPGSQVSKYELAQVVPNLDSSIRLLRAGGWVMAVMPEQQATTMTERDDVVFMARCWLADRGTMTEPASAERLRAAVDALIAAEQREGRQDAPNPMVKMAELQRDNGELQRIVKHIRQMLGGVR